MPVGLLVVFAPQPMCLLIRLGAEFINQPKF